MRFALLSFFLCPALFAAKPASWDLARLEAAPAHRWLNQTGAVRSLFYEGEVHEGKGTEVFAFYASPATVAGTAAPKKGFPGVVLIHGGGGTAFADWVHLWAKRGYAAIAMDLSGHQTQEPAWVESEAGKVPAHAAKGETRVRLANGGPEQGREQKFASISSADKHDHWPFHAVANVIRAHSLLRSLPGVNAERTAVTGISWGGYTTCIVASVDHRFKAAVPVYGCGFLFEGESVQKPAIDALGGQRQKWIDLYDPSSHLPRCKVPILFVNGSNDIHYPLDSYQKSFDAVPGARKQMRVEVKMRHNHLAGWAPEEIGRFIDSFCKGGKPLPRPGKIKADGELVRLPYDSPVPVVSAQLHYTTDDGLRSEREWQSREAAVGNGVLVAPAPPKEANTWFITLTDEKGAMVSSEVRFQ